jgi:hypothetical protein
MFRSTPSRFNSRPSNAAFKKSASILIGIYGDGPKRSGHYGVCDSPERSYATIISMETDFHCQQLAREAKATVWGAVHGEMGRAGNAARAAGVRRRSRSG